MKLRGRDPANHTFNGSPDYQQALAGLSGSAAELFQFCNRFLTRDKLTKDSVFVVKSGSGNEGNEKLAAISSGTTVGHTQQTGSIMPGFWREFAIV